MHVTSARCALAAAWLGLGLVAGCRCASEAPERSRASGGAAETTGAAGEHDAGPGPAERARALAHRVIIADGHIDVPYRLMASAGPDGTPTVDVATRAEDGDFDYPRAAAGGLDAPFMSIYVPAELQETGGAKAAADRRIDLVESLIERAPDKFAAARSPADIEANFEAGRISLPMGIENGAALEGELANLEHFADRGIRYITLTHAEDNSICDSSYADTRTWNGLSPFGEKVVREMNRLGVLVDVSHVSDAAFDRVMEITKTPVIASHSSARHFTPGFERNMSDAMIERLAASGGLIMINFGSAFIDEEAKAYFDARREAISAFTSERGVERDSPEAETFIASYEREHPPVYATVADVADHIDHVVDLAGIEHVGLGSDFDGVGDSLPTGLKDVSAYPNLFRELLERGYSEDDIERIASGNLLRVWREVAAHAEATGREAP